MTGRRHACHGDVDEVIDSDVRSATLDDGMSCQAPDDNQSYQTVPPARWIDATASRRTLAFGTTQPKAPPTTKTSMTSTRTLTLR